MSSAALPDEISSWAFIGALFDDKIAQALSGVAKRLDLIVGEGDSVSSEFGEPDGYDGVTHKGPVQRLLLSELALAAEIPEEFVRRVAESEASYLQLAHQDDAPIGRLLLICDSSPAQLGASRIGQLAALLVLFRRAQQLDVSFELGDAQHPGVSHSGDLAELVNKFLAFRTSAELETAKFAEWSTCLSSEDRAWAATGAMLGRLALEAGLSLISIEAASSEAESPTLSFSTSLGSSTVELPSAGDCVRLIRGRAYRRRTSRSREGAGLGLTQPRFAGAPMRLLFRTRDPDLVATASLPRRIGDDVPKVKQHRFDGPVVAAAFFSQRLVAVSAQSDDTLLITVRGKDLGLFNGFLIPFDLVDLIRSDVETAERQPIRPLYFQGGSLILDLPSGHWKCGHSQAPVKLLVAGATHGATTDLPWLAYRTGAGTGVYVNHLHVPTLPIVARAYLNGDGAAAWQRTDGTWVYQWHSPPAELRVDPSDEVIALTKSAGRHVLVARSTAGSLLRLCGPNGVHTLTSISGDIISVDVHPTRPLVVIQRSDDTTVVYDLEASETLATWEGLI